MRNEIGRTSSTGEERRRKTKEDAAEYQVEDIREGERLGRRRSVFALLAWDLGLDSTHRGFNTDKVFDGIKGFYIPPQNRWYKTWEKVILIWAIYSSFFTPMEFGFFRGLPDRLYLLDIFSQAAFFIDIAVQFFVPYKDTQTYKFIVSPRLIAVRYLKSHFIFDVLACMPWDILYTVQLIRPVKNQPKQLHKPSIQWKWAGPKETSRFLHVFKNKLQDIVN